MNRGASWDTIRSSSAQYPLSESGVATIYNIQFHWEESAERQDKKYVMYGIVIFATFKAEHLTFLLYFVEISPWNQKISEGCRSIFALLPQQTIVNINILKRRYPR